MTAEGNPEQSIETEEPSPFDRRIYAVPFGSYEVSPEQESPADRVLIGRAGKRAYFIDRLSNLGARGSFLITGRRGAGKTSFVRYCLEEYKSEVFERLLHSPVGRVLFWDRVVLLVLMFLAGVAALFLSGLAGHVAKYAAETEFPRMRIVLVVLLSPIAVVLVYPILYARELLRNVLSYPRPTDRSEDGGAGHANGQSQSGSMLPWRWAAAAIIAVLLLAALSLALPSLYETGILARLLIFGCGTALYLFAWNLDHETKGTGRRHWLAPGIALTTSALALFVGLTFLVFGWRFLLSSPTTPHMDLGVAALLFAAACILRVLGLRLHGAESSQRVEKTTQNPSREKQGVITRTLRFLSAFVKPGPQPHSLAQFWNSLFAVLLLAYGLYQAWGAPKRVRVLLLWLILGAVLTFFAVRLAHRAAIEPSGREPGAPRGTYFRFRPSIVLLFKAIAAVSVSAQLIRPVVVPFYTHYGLAQKIASVPVVGSKLAHLSTAAWALRASEPWQSTGQLDWVFLLLALAYIVFHLEYDLVLRPFSSLRRDASLFGGGLEGEEPVPDVKGLEVKDRQLRLRQLAELTLPWTLYKLWLPVIDVSVNLGFDRLDHRRVVHAMLENLRHQYHRTFLAWNSLLANAVRLLAFGFLAFLTLGAGDAWFRLPDTDKLTDEQRHVLVNQVRLGYPAPCAVFTGHQAGGGLAPLVCALPGGNTFFHFLYADLLSPLPVKLTTGLPQGLVHDLLHPRLHPYPDKSVLEIPGTEFKPLFTEGFHLRIHHVLLFFLFWFVGTLVLERIPILPYRSILAEIDSVLDHLTARTSLTARSARWPAVQWLQGFFSDERVRQIEQEPVDPRTVESAVLRILRKIRQTPILLPGAKNQLLTLPFPEVTFVFDELDKLGTRVGSVEPQDGTEKQAAEIMDAERRRSVALHRLLADMKNLLSSAPARFIFVGGRNLHDEWLADQTARQPLLTNIFDAEIYLQPLLIDPGGTRSDHLHDSIKRYVMQQHERADQLYRQDAERRWTPWVGLRLQHPSHESFLQKLPGEHAENRSGSEDSWKQWEVKDCSPREDPHSVRPPEAINEFEQLQLLDEFCFFLTFRSMGNPKRLKELFATFVRPKARLQEDRTETAALECHHVLRFGPTGRFQLQLVADIYRNLVLPVEDQLRFRDDKVVTSMFFLADFLFKFHRRAFSWSNLERVDELVHIHRLPDLRQILEQIVHQWSERFLHSIPNGMYAFRFRSEIAREVDYLSRRSAQQMAAFNFTLDESLALKSLYESRIRALEGSAPQEMVELVAALGELHEFDQEFETARFHYRRAIHAVDQELEQVFGTLPSDPERLQTLETLLGKHPTTALAGILTREAAGEKLPRAYLSWGIARLRLMLQIGMTYEQANDLERASVEYGDAKVLADALIKASFGTAQDRSDPGFGRLSELKHLNLLFQPSFAQAWVLEKLPGNVDSSLPIVEMELTRLRGQVLSPPWGKLEPTESYSSPRNTNFALILAELQNKVGNLYFFKGRQAFPRPDEKRYEHELAKAQRAGETKIYGGTEGYLLQAHYHYAVGLHELRRFVTQRLETSALALNAWSAASFENGASWPTLEPKGEPAFVLRSSAAALSDLAHCMIARTSLFGLFQALPPSSHENPAHFTNREADKRKPAAVAHLPRKRLPRRRPLREALKPIALADGVTNWLASLGAAKKLCKPKPEEWRTISIPLSAEKWLAAGSVDGWLGRQVRAEGVPDRLIEFAEVAHHGDHQRLAVALNFQHVAAKYLEFAGYRGDSVSLHLEIVEAVEHVLWWRLAVEKIKDWNLSDPPGFEKAKDHLNKVATVGSLEKHWYEAYWSYLFELAVDALERIDRLLPVPEDTQAAERLKGYQIGSRVPPIVAILAMSLWLVSTEATAPHVPGRPAAPFGVEQRLLALLRSWHGRTPNTLCKSQGNRPPCKSCPLYSESRKARADGEDCPLETLGPPAPGTRGPDATTRHQAVVRLLTYLVERHPYPLGHRLLALRVWLLESTLFHGNRSFWEEDTPPSGRSGWQLSRAGRRLVSAAESLFDLSEDYGASLHFTHIQLGMAGSLVALRLESDLRSRGGAKPELKDECLTQRTQLEQKARRALRQSEEMYTLRRSYYDWIVDLYYLYDDFNDPRIHFNATVQMAGAEVTSLLRAILKDLDRQRRTQ